MGFISMVMIQTELENMKLFKKSKEKAEEKSMTSVSFVLLENPEINFEKLAKDMLDDWQIELPIDDVRDEKMLTAEVNGMMVAISLHEVPIPNGEAVENAKTNRFWEDAIPAAERHQAHIMIAVLPLGNSLVDTANLFVKICASCLRQPSALAINTLGSVLEPISYIESAKYHVESGTFPVMNLVFFGIYTSDQKTWSGYTYGLEDLGKQDIEILNSMQNPNEIMGFMIDISAYLMDSDVTLRSGETIGFTAEQKLAITESKGVAIGGKTFKIDF